MQQMESLEPSKEKHSEVPQLDPETGLSHDYANEFAWAHASTSGMEADEVEEEYQEMLAKQAAKNGGAVMRTYMDVYPASSYTNVMNDKNLEGIVRLNAIASKVNTLHAEGKLTREEFLRLTKKAAEAIYAKPDAMYH